MLKFINDAKGNNADVDRRDLIKGAAAVGLLSAMGTNPALGQAAPQAAAEDPKAPPGIGKNAIPDMRFPLCYETSVPEAVRVLTKHFAALSRRDLKAVADTMHFPYGSYEGVDAVVVQTPEDLIAHPPASLSMTLNPERFTDHDGYLKPGAYDVFNGIEVLTSDPIKVAMTLCYDRYGSDGKKLLRCEGVYTATNNDGRWALQLGSTIFTPADMIGVVYDDTAQQARRLRILHDLASQQKDEDIDKLTPQYGRHIGVSGGSGWTIQTAGTERIMQGYRVKGIKSRLTVGETTPDTPMRGEGTPQSRGTYIEYRDKMGSLGLGPWGFVYGTWPGGRVVHATTDKAHLISSAVRYTAAGEEMSLAIQVVVVTFKKGRWGMDGNVATTTYHDRASDIHS